MRQVEFTVPGEPKSKERPRVTRNGTYTPKSTLDAEKAVRAAYRAAVERSGSSEYLLQGNIYVEMVFFNGTKRRRDLDNMVKLVLDALNRVAYDDDVQVHEKHVKKYFTSKERARTVVMLQETPSTYIEGE